MTPLRWLPLALIVVGLALATGGWSPARPWLFQTGLLALWTGGLLAALRASRGRRSALAPLALLLAALVFAFQGLELALLARTVLSRATPPREFPGYEEARADRADFLRWWDLHRRRWAGPDPELFEADPLAGVPFRLRPGGHSRRGGVNIQINQLGFRGPEISPDKGPSFRIVALGESTTFGLTWLADDRPWPEVLEARIAGELACDRPVQVVNAGVMGWTLANQLQRLARDVLPLAPDLLLTYHGYNGFQHFMRGVPELAFLDGESLAPRPSQIVEVLERARALRRVRAAQPDLSRAAPRIDALRVRGAPYWAQYDTLARAARLHGIALALGSFNLAVDTRSPEDAIGFFEERYPDVRSSVLANRLHTRVVRDVARRPGATFVDTSPGLDGAYAEHYVDLVHFTQSGRDLLAERWLEGLRELLAQHPRLHCRALH